MLAGDAMRCDCGYEVRARHEAACVEAVRQHAWDAHGIDLSVELAHDLVRRDAPAPTREHDGNERKENR